MVQARGSSMRRHIKDFVELTADVLELPGPICEFGVFQVCASPSDAPSRIALDPSRIESGASCDD